MDAYLSSLYSLLRLKEEQLARLIRCQSEMQQHQQAFQNDKYHCLNPELSSVTWTGMLANQFEDIRENRMLIEYEDMENNQFESVFNVISNKIMDIQSEIKSIQDSISAAKQTSVKS
ncbi:DUF5082 family protein [Fictibacillus sp. 5RED26]|uniref:YwqH-like family protein n=1 Tax=Fictibacillus sp. 5RED26 TaxID=2745876 RepID=UPI0018CE1250|nr:DUF5082 family protein [Fictibacillus sp. 5RED26]MBH0156280.1 DUF5082 family protein [Fictibacillus sp. 5RED26]